LLLYDTVRILGVGFRLRGQIVDILATKPYVSDKGCQMFLKLAIVKTVMLGAALSKTHRKVDVFVMDMYPSHSYI